MKLTTIIALTASLLASTAHAVKDWTVTEGGIITTTVLGGNWRASLALDPCEPNHLMAISNNWPPSTFGKHVSFEYRVDKYPPGKVSSKITNTDDTYAGVQIVLTDGLADQLVNGKVIRLRFFAGEKEGKPSYNYEAYSLLGFIDTYLEQSSLCAAKYFEDSSS
jgi:hypothetical protein